MASIETLLASPASWYVVATAVNASAVASFAGLPNKRHYIVGVDISASDLPAVPVSATLTDGANTLTRLEFPAGKFAPIMHNFEHVLEGSVNSTVALTLPPLGSGVRGTVTLRGFSAMA